MRTCSANWTDTFGRLSNRQISKNCWCIQHDKWSIGDSSKNKIAVSISKDKAKLSKSLSKTLENKNILSGSFICCSCVTKAKESYFKTFDDSYSNSATVSFHADDNSMENSRKVDQINEKIVRSYEK